MKENNQDPKLFIIKSDNYSLDQHTDSNDLIMVIIKGNHLYDEKKDFYFYKASEKEPWSYGKCRLSLSEVNFNIQKFSSINTKSPLQ